MYCIYSHSRWKKLATGHVSSRCGLQETGEELDRESVATTLSSLQSRGKSETEKTSKRSLNG